jgi:hypothetical protein
MKSKVLLLFALIVLISNKASTLCLDIYKKSKLNITNNWTFVEEFGANGNDSNDDKQAIQNALNASYNVSLSTGKVYYLSGTIVIPANKSFQIPVVTQIEVFIDTKKLIVTK